MLQICAVCLLIGTLSSFVVGGIAFLAGLAGALALVAGHALTVPGVSSEIWMRMTMGLWASEIGYGIGLVFSAASGTTEISPMQGNLRSAGRRSSDIS